MEVTPKQLAGLCVAVFGGIVALNFVQQFRSNEAFKANLVNLDLNGWKERLMKQEMMPDLEVPEIDEATFVQPESPAEAD